MIALKLPITYETQEQEDKMLLYIKQGTYLFRAMFKHLNKGEKVDFNSFNHYNHIELLDSWMRQSILYDAKSIVDKDDLNKSVCFGGKKNFFHKMNDIIDKEQYKFNRLHPFCVIGEKKSGTKRIYSNRRFKLLQDFSGVTFKDDNKNLIVMRFPEKIKKNYREILQKLYEHQVKGDTPLTYRVSAEGYISISYDECLVFDIPEIELEQDTVFALDQNPNYYGWTVTKWTGPNTYEIIASGVVVTKELNDFENQLIKEHYRSDSDERMNVSNHRKDCNVNIARLLVNKAIEYKCSCFSIEDLKIKSKDMQKGKYLNRLCQQQWNRRDFENSLQKHCNLNGIRLHRVPSNYTSYYGNMLYRQHILPDMCLASLEIGRRCFEFMHQYVFKDFKVRKNIVHPDYNDFQDRFKSVLNELNIDYVCNQKNYSKDLYEYIKKKNIKYRVLIDKFKDNKRLNVDFSKFICEIIFTDK